MESPASNRRSVRAFPVLLALICLPAALLLALLGLSEDETALFFGAGFFVLVGVLAFLPSPLRHWAATLIALTVATTAVWNLLLNLTEEDGGPAGGIRLFLVFGVSAFGYLFWRVNPLKAS